MSTDGTFDQESEDHADAVEKMTRMVQRRSAAVGVNKMAEILGEDPDSLADMIFGTPDGSSPDLVQFLKELARNGLTLVPSDGVVLDGKTLKDLLYGVLASLEATKEDLRRNFGRELVNDLLRAGINHEDGTSLIRQVVQLKRELFAARDKASETAPGGDSMKPAVGKSRTTMVRLIGGLVQANYKIDLKSDRLDGIGAILRDLETVGVSLDEGTLRDYLREAAMKIESRTKTRNS
ncbi:hypothetical protein QZM89_22340 [Burkholderia gladioli]|uniref:hypothetical protein n=1 Tax=Burkholderia gladioli TaxID=28095 RepID=UPI00264B9799|nr:hypothetical protein [Burkholderia gladioli]MDN7497945.1 hypothetical protein [Burkholderia gladioli]